MTTVAVLATRPSLGRFWSFARTPPALQRQGDVSSDSECRQDPEVPVWMQLVSARVETEAVPQTESESREVGSIWLTWLTWLTWECRAHHPRSVFRSRFGKYFSNA
eukprot:631250-Prorocentrum_minimum.AAC.4